MRDHLAHVDVLAHFTDNEQGSQLGPMCTLRQVKHVCCIEGTTTDVMSPSGARYLPCRCMDLKRDPCIDACI